MLLSGFYKNTHLSVMITFIILQTFQTECKTPAEIQSAARKQRLYPHVIRQIPSHVFEVIFIFKRFYVNVSCRTSNFGLREKS